MAERLGFSRAQANKVIRQKRGHYKQLVADFVSGKNSAEREFTAIGDTCVIVRETAPEMKAHR